MDKFYPTTFFWEENRIKKQAILPEEIFEVKI